MDLGLKGKSAVVMAGSKGLGKGVATKLAEEGANVLIISRNIENLKKAKEEIESSTKKEIEIFQGDVTKKEDVDAAIKEAAKKFGTIHILFTNAGGPPPGGFFDVKAEDYLTAVQLNLMSTIYAVYAAVPYMKKNKWGRIIASVSISVKQPLDNLILSNVSRAGIITFIKTVANAVAPFNITANAVLPGYTMTDRVKQLIENGANKKGTTFEKEAEKIIKNIPAGRIGLVEEFSSVVAFLASEEASYITGSSIPIDGGFIKCI
jgi:3-oxoacyl-[acyl-carrier protein] reductase